jgi:hypothetical protein
LFFEQLSQHFAVIRDRQPGGCPNTQSVFQNDAIAPRGL